MTDTPATVGATALMGDGSTPTTATPDHRAQAYAKLGELGRDPDFQRRVIAGDAAARKELADLKLTVAQPTGLVVRGKLTDGQLAMATDALQESGALTDAEIQQIGQPISKEESKLAHQELSRLKRDKGFITKLYDGDREARARWDRLHILITSPIKLDAQ
jgi:hypothetical protein